MYVMHICTPVLSKLGHHPRIEATLHASQEKKGARATIFDVFPKLN